MRTTFLSRLWLRSRWLHLLFWAAALAYFFVAPGLHYRWFAVEGKSTPYIESLPKVTSKGEIYIDDLSTVTRTGEPLYRLSGWAFITLDPALEPKDYTRMLLLTPADNTSNSRLMRLTGRTKAAGYTYPVSNVRRAGLQKFFEDAPMELSSAGFFAAIAADSLPPGAYKINILFTHPTTGKSYLLKTGRTIVRSVNEVDLN